MGAAGWALEAGETIEDCLVREVREELGVGVRVGPLLDAWLYELAEATVLVLTYGCMCDSNDGMKHSAEHRGLAWLPIDALQGAPIPEGYLRAVERWRDHSPRA
jgi:8-oxo-dGTP pyrophosphatase MutT (NUDIX family)